MVGYVKINECIVYKLISLTYKVVTTSQPDYLLYCDLCSAFRLHVEPARHPLLPICRLMFLIFPQIIRYLLCQYACNQKLMVNYMILQDYLNFN